MTEKRAISAARAFGALQARASQGVRVAPQIMEHAARTVGSATTPASLRKMVLEAGSDARSAARTQQMAAHPTTAAARANAERVMELERTSPQLMQDMSQRPLELADYGGERPASQLKKDMLFGTGDRSQLLDPQGLLATPRSTPVPAATGTTEVTRVPPARAARQNATRALRASKVAAARKIQFRDLDVQIETDRGEFRYWRDPNSGQSGKTKMEYPYGYIRRTKGMDGEEVDVFVGRNEQAPNVYVITTNKAPGFQAPDEEKCMLGFSSAEDAKQAFLRHYNDERFFRSIRAIPYEQFAERARATAKGTQRKIAEAAGAVEKDLGVPLVGAPHIILEEPSSNEERIESAFDALDVPQKQCE